jgi:hypothetical protein
MAYLAPLRQWPLDDAHGLAHHLLAREAAGLEPELVDVHLQSTPNAMTEIPLRFCSFHVWF